MQDRPTAPELLDAIAELLEGPLLESSHGGLRHQVRVAGNLSRVLQREFELGPAQSRSAGAALAGLLERDPEEGADALHRALYQRLIAGDEVLERRAWPVLLEIVRSKLAVDKPGYDSFDFEGELP